MSWLPLFSLSHVEKQSLLRQLNSIISTGILNLFVLVGFSHFLSHFLSFLSLALSLPLALPSFSLSLSPISPSLS